MGQTIAEKLAQSHMTEGPDRPVRAGDFVSLRPRHVMTHDNTAAVMKKFRGIGAGRVHDSRQPVFALDHDIQNQSPQNVSKYQEIEAFAREQRVDFYPAGHGIGHQAVVDQGYAVPGALVVASDSHSNTYGAVGALGTPVVRTDAAAIWATGEFWWQVPPTVQVWLEGELRQGVSGKDVILALCGLYQQGEALNMALEFAGPGVATLSLDARLTIANMSTEWGALTGWFPVDEVTLRFLEVRRQHLLAQGVDRLRAEDLETWRRSPPAPDADASYAGRVTLDLSQVTPHVAGPDKVSAVRPLTTVAAERIPVHKAYLLSCVNARLSDLQEAASVLKGQRVASQVQLYLAAASAEIQAAAEEDGTWGTLLDAGAVALPPGCGACIGLGQGLLEAGEVGISATNRNFKGRMGSRDAQCFLASPAVVAASAVAGRIVGPEGSPPAVTLEPRFERLSTPAPAVEEVTIREGFPRTLSGRLVFLPHDSLNTDGIYGKDYTYREDMTREMMAKVVMENYDPEFTTRTTPGDLVVAGRNFGTGSSREQAVTALQAKGIPCVIAASFSQTYLRNAFNNGFLCLESPTFVDRLLEQLAGEARTLIPGDQVTLDFARGRLTWRGEEFPFPALGTVPQGLVVAGGVEQLVRQRLGLS